jgi:mono/diheme cytochrome c family protein
LNASAFDLKPQGDIAVGERVFFVQGRCGTCHMVEGRGAGSAPDLSSIGKSLTAHGLEMAMGHAAFNKSAAADTNQIWKGSPMTYPDHGRQYVATAGGSTIYSFALDSGVIDQK